MKFRNACLLLLLLPMIIVSGISCSDSGNGGAGGDASEAEIIEAIEDALGGMSVIQSAFGSSGGSMPPSGGMAAQPKAAPIPDGMNLSDIIKDLSNKNESFMTKLNAAIDKMSQGTDPTPFTEQTDYGEFKVKMDKMAGEAGTQAMTISNVVISVGDTLMLEIPDGTISTAGTAVQDWHFRYTDKREYSGYLVEFDARMEITASMSPDASPSAPAMESTLSDLKYKGTPREVTDNINKAAAEMLETIILGKTN